MEINRKKTVKVNAKTLRVQCKVRDEFGATLADEQGEVISEYDGYVPEFMPGEHYGDYLMLDIDIDTGMITNWRKPSPEQLEKFIGEESEEE